ncbi:hypothetical protein CYLTODRAFT_428652 [Cylindrobasidium torrendii FP15055 ss-10]|uniref:Transglutaminase-like domain-containing protein n=1 Tax=Cylindrobasidium torrendii FP15055 ss-10 TaxID=1314674 RepID=A0A0D7BS34_9AGAR|nr:hypothetical protein CYLTODRAFT_428652 [Cylindrobasidium torrendii FP15055 ss-10]
MSAASCLKCHDFAFIDYHASLFPRNDVVSLEALARDLTSPFGTETEKARAIFAWMHHNVVYDTAAFFAGNLRAMSPEDTLRSGLTMCDGYAGLFAYLAEYAGLQAHKVNGHGKGLGFKATQPGAPPPAFAMNHAWNCVLMDGEWRLIDCCWGAGAVDGTNYVPRLTTMWFGSDAAEFGRRHFPEEEGYQLLAEPMKWEDYILEPPGPTIFGVFYEQNFDPYLLQPAASEVQGGQWASVQLFKICEHMSTAEEDNYVYLMATPDGNRTPLRVNEYGGWSAEVWIPAGSGELSLYYVTKLGEQDGKGQAPDVDRVGYRVW